MSAVVLAGFCSFLTLFMTQPLLPNFVRIFGISRVAASLTVTAATVGVALAAPLIGIVADRVGRKRVIVWSAYLLAFATLLGATAGSLSGLIWWRFIQGLCTPGIFAITVAYIQEEWAGRGAGRATAAYVTGTALGGFCSRLFAGLTADKFGWKMSFAVIGILGLAAATALIYWLPREQNFSRDAQSRSTWSAAVDHLQNSRLLATYFAGFCILFSLLGAFTYITFYLAAPPFSLGSSALGSLFFVYLAGAVITPNSGKVIDRYGQRFTIVIAITFSALGILSTLSSDLIIVIAGLAATCSGFFVAQSCTNSFIGLAATHSKALAVGLYVTFYYLGGSAGASLPGYLWNFGGWPACVTLFVVVQALAVFAALTWWDRDPQPSQSATVPVLPD